jgi:pantoate--beta-alanine ligase
MRAIEQVAAMQAWSREVRTRERARIALVPTMGALHRGHLSLLEIARRHADKVVVSVFVNPTQFDRADDYARYPHDIDQDGALLAGAGADVLFAPTAAEMYPAGAQTFVSVEQLAAPLCGAHRPGHFRGVATVVLKLCTIVQPHVAVFGEKDYQQLALVRRMVTDLHVDVAVIGAPIVRERDGLALSSRNRHLGADERRAAPILARALDGVEEAVAGGTTDGAALAALAAEILAREPLARAEYVAIVDPDTLAPVAALGEGAAHAVLALAVWVGGTRLIDNRLLTVPAVSRERRSA